MIASKDISKRFPTRCFEELDPFHSQLRRTNLPLPLPPSGEVVAQARSRLGRAVQTQLSSLTDSPSLHLPSSPADATDEEVGLSSGSLIPPSSRIATLEPASPQTENNISESVEDSSITTLPNRTEEHQDSSCSDAPLTE